MLIKNNLILICVISPLLWSCVNQVIKQGPDFSINIEAAETFRASLLSPEKKKQLLQITNFIANRSNLTAKEVQEAMQGTPRNLAASQAFESFSGHWQGYWEQKSKVQQYWRTTRNYSEPKFSRSHCISLRIGAVQYVTMNDGYGWNAVVYPILSSKKRVILGSVVHLQPGQAGASGPPKPKYVVPHIGILISETELVWVTPQHLFWELIKKTSAGGGTFKKEYHIRQYSLSGDAKAPLKQKFQTVYQANR